VTGRADTVAIRLRSLPSERARTGAPIDVQGRVLQLTFEDSISKSDKATLQLDNSDLALFDRAELAGGALWELSWGYPDAMAAPRRVVVRKLTGFETLTVEAHSLGVLMDRQTRTRTFRTLRRTEIARAIAREHGYDGALVHIDDDGPVLDTIVQAGESDSRFLRRLAHLEGREFTVDESGFRFERPKKQRGPARVFTWRDPTRGDVLSIHVESNLAARVGRVEARGRDLLRKQDVATSATKDSTPRPTLAPVVEVVEPVDPETGASALTVRTSTLEVRPLSPVPAAEAQARAHARFAQAETPSVKLAMQVIGDAGLAAGQVVEMRGIGRRLSGLYRLVEVKHQVSGTGYVCDLSLRRDGVSTRLADAGGARHGQPQGGEPQPSTTPPPGALTERQFIDPETGRELSVFVPDGARLGAHDPEGRP